MWFAPLAVAGVGAVILLAMIRRSVRSIPATRSSVARVRGELAPLIGSLRQELSRAAAKRRPEDTGVRQ